MHDDWDRALAIAESLADAAADAARADGAGPMGVARDELVRSYVRSYADSTLREGVARVASQVLLDGGVAQPTARELALAIVALAREHVDADLELLDEDFRYRAPGAGEFSLRARDFLGSCEFDDLDSAYAVLDDDGTLTFVRSADHVEGGRRGSVVDLGGVRREGVVFAGFEDGGEAPWAAERIRAVAFEDAVRPVKTARWFAGQGGLRRVDGAGLLDLSSCFDASEMFRDCRSLASIDVSGWDVRSLERAYCMFADCRSLSSLDVSGWDTFSLEHAVGMFYDCSGLATLDVSRWDTGHLWSATEMFDGCSSLANLDVSGWDTRELAEAEEMFRDCRALATLDVSGWDTSKVTDMRYMFYRCSSLASLDVSRWDTAGVTDMGYMFYDCSSLAALDVSRWDTGRLLVATGMFDGCRSLATLDVSRWDVRALADARDMFSGCSSLANLDVSGWDTRSLADASGMFRGCPAGDGISLALPGRDGDDRGER